jgi:DMSO/TMAO reductase YedYZ molybdopterin-dependent catalytic subunit
MRVARTALLVSLIVTPADPRAVAGQDVEKTSRVVLSVGGEVARPLTLTAQELSRLPRQTIHAKDRDGKEVEFEGVPVVAVLKAAGVKFGSDLRGPALANYLVVEAADGYRAVFSLPEIDPDFTDHIILLADRRDGKPLGGNEGPLRVVVLGEKRQTRWVRQVVALKVGRG